MNLTYLVLTLQLHIKRLITLLFQTLMSIQATEAVGKHRFRDGDLEWVLRSRYAGPIDPWTGLGGIVSSSIACPSYLADVGD